MHTLELRIPPVVLTLAFCAAMWLLGRVTPFLRFNVQGSRWIALLLVAAGVFVIVLGIAEFNRASTTVNPTQPESSSSVVTSGIYRWSRNPMYAGFLLILAGWAMELASIAAVALLPAFVLYMNRYQIQPEERALTGKFGAEYLAYRQRVRRWL
jgi:protein-S-isoprenylcysteine O-methyltransferase Ste14